MDNILGKPRLLKEINKNRILQFIKSKETVTRAEVTENTQISHTTVRVILNELIESGEIISIGLDKSSGGRPAEKYKINANINCIIVASIEDKRLLYRVLNIVGEIIEESSIAINSKDDEESILSLFDSIINKYKNLKYIGITVPGIVTENGYITGSGVDDWKEVSLISQLRNKFNIPCILENDLNSIALGYFKTNIECNNMIYLLFTDLGVGGGIVINGKVFKGNEGYAGEVGILPINDTYLNEIVLRNSDDNEYIDAVVKTLKIISGLLNPKTIVLGGEKFRLNLKDKIIKEYNDQLNIKTNIVVDEKQDNYGLLGISEIILKNYRGDIMTERENVSR